MVCDQLTKVNWSTNEKMDVIKTEHSTHRGIWLASGFIVLLILSAIAVALLRELDCCTLDTRANLELEPSATQVVTRNEVFDAQRKELIDEIYSRKGYLNPGPSPEDGEYTPGEVYTKTPKSSRRWKIIDPNTFNSSGSLTIIHPNGSMTYVFPQVPKDSISVNSSALTSDPSPFTTTETFEFDIPSGDYPEEAINDVMKKYESDFKGAFGEDFLQPKDDALRSRYDISDELFVCDSKETLHHPRGGVNLDNKEVMIINTKEYKQGIRREVCVDGGRPCSTSEPRTVCKQVYHYRLLLAFDPVKKKPYPELIRLPSCCKCAILRN